MEVDPRNTLLEGAISAEAALAGGRREVHRVWLDRERDDGPARRIRKLARAQGVRWTPASRAALDAHAQGGTHGGVIAEVGDRLWTPLDEALAAAAAPGAGFLAMLDGVEDPFNFGQSVRSLYAAGAAGVVVRPRNWTSAAAVVARASAGATERIGISVAAGPDEARDAARAAGLRVAAAAGVADAVAPHEADLTGPLLLVIGGERRGLRRSFLQTVDAVVAVPYARPFPAALGTVAAASVVAFEAARQRAGLPMGSQADPAGPEGG
ncbi:TrmH family RNA methyltransferase [Phycisphaera mikurensis]|uniref:Putative RNA methyltransferase n=1 Tax=Phycisphaera mikurensis (strain NBRC 102666 / KCTC 22515 / FYK2301M01) TaxID=1142394 RepID=I0IAK9_PHYMF|nr:TrmH family RNA methyltransferase [Phycisphaera mikurensis]MBB6441707.1 23S rRNA (guanosine2251-2'-O)-methyltransferase [Phycisphaera mikurensis]BAM02297.1 putative RNA methyltransferase [Phycisphaera mikurensis NBRC 102666]